MSNVAHFLPTQGMEKVSDYMEEHQNDWGPRERLLKRDQKQNPEVSEYWEVKRKDEVPWLRLKKDQEEFVSSDNL